MTIYMKHEACKQPIAKFTGKELPQPGYRIRSRDFVLMTGKRPKPFGPIVCHICKCTVNVQDIYLESDDANDGPVTRLN